MAIASSRRRVRDQAPRTMARRHQTEYCRGISCCRRRGRPGRGRLLLRRCGRRRSRGGRCRSLGLRRRRGLGGSLLLRRAGFLTGFGWGGAGVSSTMHRVGPQFRGADAGRNRLDMFRFGLVAVEREGHCQRPRSPAARARRACGRFVRWRSWLRRPAARIRTARCPNFGAGFSASRLIQSGVDEHAARARPPLTIAITRYIILTRPLER